MPNNAFMDAIYEEGVLAARCGADRGANPYFSDVCRRPWFQGFDDFTGRPHIRRELRPLDVVIYALVFVGLALLLFLPIK